MYSSVKFREKWLIYICVCVCVCVFIHTYAHTLGRDHKNLTTN